MKIGFTGTQNGTTAEQLVTLEKLLRAQKLDEFHHGDCIGADDEAVGVVKEIKRHPPLAWKKKPKIICHPPSNDSKRAWNESDEERTPKPYLDRNHDIVNESKMLIATPKGFREELRSGTWATVRYARKQGKQVIIVWPDGSTTRENFK